MKKGFSETAELHKRLQNSQFIAKKIPYPRRKLSVPAYHRRQRQQSLCEIRNKYTQEIVDLEVCICTCEFVVVRFNGGTGNGF